MTSPVNPQRLMQINSMKFNNLRVGNFRVVPQILRLGDLKGNKFTIVIRFVQFFDGFVFLVVYKLSVTVVFALFVCFLMFSKSLLKDNTL